MIVMKRTLQQLLGGAPFIISGACGMFRTDVLRKFGFSDRTKVEDLDLTWTLVANGSSVFGRQNRCIVYCHRNATARVRSGVDWRRWIVGYAVCMRLHKRLVFSRFGMLQYISYAVGCAFMALGFMAHYQWFNEFITTGPHGVVLANCSCRCIWVRRSLCYWCF
ncbi:glycosyltransferase [Escherichia coli]